MSDGGSANSINAQFEAEQLAARNRRDPDAADERAERVTRTAGTAAGVVAVVAATWLFAGATAGLIAAGIAALIAAGFAVRWRMASHDAGLDPN